MRTDGDFPGAHLHERAVLGFCREDSYRIALSVCRFDDSRIVEYLIDLSRTIAVQSSSSFLLATLITGFRTAP